MWLVHQPDHFAGLCLWSLISSLIQGLVLVSSEEAAGVDFSGWFHWLHILFYRSFYDIFLIKTSVPLSFILSVGSQVKTQFKRETKVRTIRSLTGLTAIAKRECRADVGAAVRALRCTQDTSKPSNFIHQSQFVRCILCRSGQYANWVRWWSELRTRLPRPVYFVEDVGTEWL